MSTTQIEKIKSLIDRQIAIARRHHNPQAEAYIRGLLDAKDTIELVESGHA